METLSTANHSIYIQERKIIEIEGVKKLESFDKEEFLVETNMGMLYIKGKDLALGNMDTVKGTLSIRGHFDSLAYLKSKSDQKKESVFKKIFK